MKYLHNSHILSAHSWMISRSPHQYTGGTHSLHRSATFRAQYGTILQTFQRYSPVLWARRLCCGSQQLRNGLLKAKFSSQISLMHLDAMSGFGTYMEHGICCARTEIDETPKDLARHSERSFKKWVEDNGQLSDTQIHTQSVIICHTDDICSTSWRQASRAAFSPSLLRTETLHSRHSAAKNTGGRDSENCIKLPHWSDFSPTDRISSAQLHNGASCTPAGVLSSKNKGSCRRWTL